MSRSTPATAAISPYDFRSWIRRTSGAAPACGGLASAAALVRVDKCLLQDLEPAVEILLLDDERDEDPDHVALEATGEQDQAELVRSRGDALRTLAVGPLRFGVLDELECKHRAEAAHLADAVHAARDRVELGADALAELPGLGEEGVVTDAIEHGRRGCAGQRIATEGSAEAAGADRVHQLGAPGNGRERQAAAERLAGHEQVRLDAVVLGCPHRPGPADAALHLVGHVQDPVPLAELLQAAREVLGHDDEPALALHGLEDDARDGRGIDVLAEEQLKR